MTLFLFEKMCFLLHGIENRTDQRMTLFAVRSLMLLMISCNWNVQHKHIPQRCCPNNVLSFKELALNVTKWVKREYLSKTFTWIQQTKSYYGIFHFTLYGLLNIQSYPTALIIVDFVCRRNGFLKKCRRCLSTDRCHLDKGNALSEER